MSGDRHDPHCPAYCPAPDTSWIAPGGGLPKCRGGDCTICDETDCQCELIALVQADARRTAIDDCLRAVEVFHDAWKGERRIAASRIIYALRILNDAKKETP